MEARERNFEYGGLRLAALEWPGEGLPILALHGWLDNAASFIPLSTYLQGHHLLALELPGHGHSDHLPPAAHYHLADNLHVLAAVADEMGWQRFVLLGHSMGAAIACLAAAAMPQRVIGLSLIDGLGPIAFQPSQEVQRLRELFEQGNGQRNRRPFKDIDTAVRVWQLHSRFPITIETAEMIVKRGLRKDDKGYHWRYDERLTQPSTHYYSDEQVKGILTTIESPGMLLSGDAGALSEWQGFNDRKMAFSGLQHRVLPGGHHLHMESPELVAEHLNDFYDQLKGNGQ
jgi:pimeloyl-ACP methyl ester carboxylesterase